MIYGAVGFPVSLGGLYFAFAGSAFFSMLEMVIGGGDGGGD